MTDKSSLARKQSEHPFVISRIFNAPRALVWDAFTRRERLMQWWGPKGFTVTACDIDMKPGGVFLYALRGPDGNTIWGKWIFREIVKPERLTVISSFSDEKGGVTRHPFVPDWPLETLSTTTFAEKDGKTLLTVSWSAYNATDAERAVFDGGHDSMRMGWGGTFDQLAAYLESL